MKRLSRGSQVRQTSDSLKTSDYYVDCDKSNSLKGSPSSTQPNKQCTNSVSGLLITVSNNKAEDRASVSTTVSSTNSTGPSSRNSGHSSPYSGRSTPNSNQLVLQDASLIEHMHPAPHMLLHPRQEHHGANARDNAMPQPEHDYHYQHEYSACTAAHQAPYAARTRYSDEMSRASSNRTSSHRSAYVYNVDRAAPCTKCHCSQRPAAAQWRPTRSEPTDYHRRKPSCEPPRNSRVGELAYRHHSRVLREAMHSRSAPQTRRASTRPSESYAPESHRRAYPLSPSPPPARRRRHSEEQYESRQRWTASPEYYYDVPQYRESRRSAQYVYYR
jgi:hypothetical protein